MRKIPCFIPLLSMALWLPLQVRGEFLDLATMPLQTSGSSDVLPNLMFVLDNSGSMGWNYTPDWAALDPQDSSANAPNWLFRNAAYNTQFYNPQVYYSPPLTYLGIAMASQTNFSNVANAVTETGATSGGTSNLVGAANYFAYVPGEFCTTANQTSCTIAKAATGIYTFPATLRWCNTAAAASARSLSGTQRCQAIRNDVTSVNDSNTYNNLRQPRATYTLTLVRNSGTVTVSSIKINNIELMSQSTSSTSSTGLATNVQSRICTSTLTGNCRIAGNTVSRNNNVLTISTPVGESLNTSTYLQVTLSGSGTATAQPVAASSTDVAGSLVYVDIVSSTNSYTNPGSSSKHAERTDCLGSTCTYTEEMTNYANWWAYYRTRMQAMKTAASQAFKALDARYRVGFVTINNGSSNYLSLAPFNTAQKQSWYQKLFAVSPTGSTPLRTALSSVGRHYAGKKVLGNDDPVQYACQSNFTLLTTDGYWNDTTTPRQINGSTAIGNQDSGSTPRPQFDSSNQSNTLADVAKYYYDTDLRETAQSNCTGALGSSVCGTVTDYPKQSMVTLTLGLGISGTLAYTEDYKTQSVGDFKDITTGAKNWDDPINNTSGQRIDDLWHAAVNGGGTYYSASNPKLLRESLSKGLAEIKAVQGASAAAAASSLAPTNGDNFQYVASYQTVKWIGNLEARTVNVNTLETSRDAVWCVENVAATSCAAPAVQTQFSSGGSTSVYCKTTASNQTLCDNAGGILGSVLGTNEASACYVEVASSCSGRLQTQVANNTRRILFNLNGTLTSFDAASLPSQYRTALSNGYLAMSQIQGLPASDPKVTDVNKVNKLVDYLRGNKTYEDTASNAISDNRLFRERQATLGDISQSRPNYFKVSNAAYLDAGYTAFKAASANRLAAVYVGANDGMLHAFNANTGDELWAMVPTPVIPNLANLADKEYGAAYHTNYVNGNPVVADICTANCTSTNAVWKTILVTGLNGGGRGYLALDVTDPNNPLMLWEFTAQANSSNLGFSYGNPVVTKLQDGRWVVLLTSGYNNGTYASKKTDGSFISNTPVGDGRGYLYVLNASSGSVIRTLTTGEGTPSDPSGLSRISGYTENMFENNSALNVYGGDLNGNVWRFNINTGTVSKMASLRDANGTIQKITTQPELGKINSHVVLMLGTGKFLEAADLTNTPLNSVYTLKDAQQTTAVTRAQMVGQSLSANRVVSTAAINFDNSFGWYIDFPAGERVNLDPLLVNGVLLMPTLVPNSAACNGAGYGWFNYFNYKTGGSVLTSGVVSERMTTPAVGYNIVYDAAGVPHVVATGSNDPTPQDMQMDDVVFEQSGTASMTEIFGQKANGSYGTKQSWRELIP